LFICILPQLNCLKPLQLMSSSWICSVDLIYDIRVKNCIFSVHFSLFERSCSSWVAIFSETKAVDGIENKYSNSIIAQAVCSTSWFEYGPSLSGCFHNVGMFAIKCFLPFNQFSYVTYYVFRNFDEYVKYVQTAGIICLVPKFKICSNDIRKWTQ